MQSCLYVIWDIKIRAWSIESHTVECHSLSQSLAEPGDHWGVSKDRLCHVTYLAMTQHNSFLAETDTVNIVSGSTDFILSFPAGISRATSDFSAKIFKEKKG